MADYGDYPGPGAYAPPEIVHACPTDDSSGVTLCCGKTPFELPDTDRITVDSSRVTCLSPSEREVMWDAIRSIEATWALGEHTWTTIIDAILAKGFHLDPR